MKRKDVPSQQGLYNPSFEKDSCGVGFVVDVKGRKSHQIVQQALTVLNNLRHRGACGCEANTGDGAGILLQIPHHFLKEAAGHLGIKLPAAGAYGIGMVYLSPDPKEREEAKQLFAGIVKEEGQTFLCWRDVSTQNKTLGPTAIASQPFV